jgi:hypothetical protein
MLVRSPMSARWSCGDRVAVDSVRKIAGQLQHAFLHNSESRNMPSATARGHDFQVNLCPASVHKRTAYISSHCIPDPSANS